MQKNDDPGKFRQVDEIIYVVGYPGYQHLSSIAENCMQVVCDVKGDNILLSYLLFFVWSYYARWHDISYFMEYSIDILSMYLT